MKDQEPVSAPRFMELTEAEFDELMSELTALRRSAAAARREGNASDPEEALAGFTTDELLGELVRRSDSLLIAAQFKSRRAMKANGPLVHLYGLHRALEAFICQVPIEMRGTGGEHAG